MAYRLLPVSHLSKKHNQYFSKFAKVLKGILQAKTRFKYYSRQFLALFAKLRCKMKKNKKLEIQKYLFLKTFAFCKSTKKRAKISLHCLESQ